MPKIDSDALDWAGGSGYPEPFATRIGDRTRKRLGNAGGLTQFGVNLARLGPGAQSALRHWHENEDEFVYILEGELTLIEDDGETVLRPGDAAALYLEIVTRATDEVGHYPDDDLHAVKTDGAFRFTPKDNGGTG